MRTFDIRSIDPDGLLPPVDMAECVEAQCEAKCEMMKIKKTQNALRRLHRAWVSRLKLAQKQMHVIAVSQSKA